MVRIKKKKVIRTVRLYGHTTPTVMTRVRHKIQRVVGVRRASVNRTYLKKDNNNNIIIIITMFIIILLAGDNIYSCRRRPIISYFLVRHTHTHARVRAYRVSVHWYLIVHPFGSDKKYVFSQTTDNIWNLFVKNLGRNTCLITTDQECVVSSTATVGTTIWNRTPPLHGRPRSYDSILINQYCIVIYDTTEHTKNVDPSTICDVYYFTIVYIYRSKYWLGPFITRIISYLENVCVVFIYSNKIDK